jgi:hypothetical protein
MELARITIPQYIRQVTIAKKRRPIYYTFNKDKREFLAKTKNIPKSFIEKGNLKVAFYNKSNKWVDTQPYNINHYSLYAQLHKAIIVKDGELLLSNPKTVNTPNILTIRGQDFYSGNLREHTRAFVMQEIKKSFIPYLKDIPSIEDFPVRIRLEIHDTIKNSLEKGSSELGNPWDIGNRAYPYGKAFLDLLCSGRTGEKDKNNKYVQYFYPKLPDDNRLYVTEDPQGGIFCPLAEGLDDSHRKLVFIVEQDTRDIIVNNPYYINLKKVEKEPPF